MPVAAGKKMANTEKNPSPSLKSGPKFSVKMEPVKGRRKMCVQVSLTVQTLIICAMTLLICIIGPKERLALIIEKTFCPLFIVAGNDRSNEEICNSDKKDNQKNNLGL